MFIAYAFQARCAALCERKTIRSTDLTFIESLARQYTPALFMTCTTRPPFPYARSTGTSVSMQQSVFVSHVAQDIELFPR